MKLKILITLLFLIAFFIFGRYQYYAGFQAAKNEDKSIIQQLKDTQAKQAYEASRAYQKTKQENDEKKAVQYVEVEKIVTRDVYRHVCFDDDGVRELNRAITE